MEQSILENSKGATYMSFILDIEIVIKKDGARVNIAETKTKSQVSKKKEGESKEPYASSRNQDTKAYAVSEPHRRTIFELPLDDEGKSNLYGSNKDQSAKTDRFEKTGPKPLSKKYSDVSKTSTNKENIPENKNFEDRTSISDGGNLLPINIKPKKKKITKAEKKAKVFKGKVEPIDFLECNRIFMCNYLKIPISTNKRISNCNNRPSNSKVSTPDENDSNSPGVEHTALSTQKLDKQTFKPLRLHKFWKKNSSYLVNNDPTLDRYSSGDGDAVNTSYIASNEWEMGKLRTTEISDSNTAEKKHQMRRKRFISEFKFTKIKANSFRGNTEILDTGDNQNISTEHSCVHKEQYRQSRVLRKSKSIPKTTTNMNLQFVSPVKSDVNQYQHFKCNKRKSFSFMRTLKNKMNSKTYAAKEGLLGLQIKCFDDVNFVLAPQSNIEDGSTKISNCSVESTYILKEENLDGMEKESYEKFNDLGELSNETDNINSTIREITYIGTHSKSNSSLVVEDRVSSSNIKVSVPKNDKIEGKYDDITVKNTEENPFTNTEILTDLCLISKSDTCVISPQKKAIEINISSSALEENYLNGNTYTMRENSCGDNLENEELKTNISNDKALKTTLVISSQHTLNERPTQQWDADVSQIVIENQSADINEKRDKQNGNLKTPKLKTLHSYMKIVTSKFQLWK